MKSWPLALQKSAEADADDACQGPGQHGISDAAYAADGYCCCQLEQPNQLMLMMMMMRAVAPCTLESLGS